jgi:hypothetical protein
MANQVAKKEDAPLAVSLDDLANFAGAGVEEVKKDDIAIPYVNIIQSNSPQASKHDGKYIEGAEVGMIFNSVTNETFDGEKGIEVIPCAYKRELDEWIPREQDGGFVTAHSIESTILSTTTKNEKGQDILPNGNYLVNTAKHFVLLLGTKHGSVQAILPMKGTQLKKSRRWNTQMMSQTVTVKDGSVKPYPSFAYAYTIKTAPEKNALGSWFGYEVLNQRPVTPEEFKLGASFYGTVMSGAITTAPQEEGKEVSDDVPF